MNRIILACIAAVLGGCAMGGDGPPGPYDGTYFGPRVLTYGADACRETDIEGEVGGGWVKLRLLANAAALTGRIGEDGTFIATGHSGRYKFTFTGKAEPGALSGDWTIYPNVCGGTWRLLKKA